MIICPKCGAKSTEKDFAGPFCIDCYEFKFKLPKKVIFKKCKNCERIWLGEWVKFNKKKIEEIIASKFKGNFEKVDYYLDSGTVVIYFKVDDKIKMVNAEFEPKYDIVLCPDCSRRSGGYYEAILQLRGNKSKVEKYSKKLYIILDRKTYVTKVEEKKEGIDLFIGSSKTLMELLKEMGLTYKITRKLSTQKQGKRLYRSTFVIRFE